MRTNSMIALTGAALTAGFLGGCQSVESTRVTVMNESASGVLVDIMTVEPDQVEFSGEQLDAGAVRAFLVEHPDDGTPSIRVGVQPAKLNGVPAKWIGFSSAGPFLVRIQGLPTDLRLMGSSDAPGLEVRDLPEPDLNRRGAEPPVNSSHR